MSTQPQLAVAIVSYNTAELTLQTLTSLCHDLESSNLTAVSEIIVVDNASSDDSVKGVRAFAKKSSATISIITNKKNVGFARANNQAISASSAEYILLLNSDTIVQPGAIRLLLTAMQESPEESTAVLAGYPKKLDRVGIIAATLTNPDGTIQPQGGSYPTLWALACHMLLLDDIPLIGRFLPSTQHTGRRTDVASPAHHLTGKPSEPTTQLKQKDWVAGTAMLLRREMLDEIGLLDENIFMYAEDMELCMRARHRHWDVAIHQSAFVTHLGSASAGSQRAILGEFQGYLYIWKKHFPRKSGIAELLLRTGALLRRWIFGTIGDREKSEMYQVVLKSI